MAKYTTDILLNLTLLKSNLTYFPIIYGFPQNHVFKIIDLSVGKSSDYTTNYTSVLWIYIQGKRLQGLAETIEKKCLCCFAYF